MILFLATLLLVTFVATWWARSLAQERGRHVSGWMYATVMLPPVVLILWLLPPRAKPAH